MANAVVQALEQAAKRIGKTLSKDAAEAIKKMYTGAGEGIKQVVKNITKADDEHIRKFLELAERVGKDEAKSGAEKRTALRLIEKELGPPSLTVTIKRPGSVPVSEWAKKATALAEASSHGALAKTAPVRDLEVTAAYRQDLIKRVWSQFASQNRPFADSLIKKLADGTIHMDHRVDLQIGGLDEAKNIQPLFGRVNTSVGSQIGNQLRGKPFGTPISIEIEP